MEENYSANDCKLLGMIHLLQRFRCYLECSSFKVLTDNQILNRFFTNTSPGRSEARQFGFLGSFGITLFMLVKGKIHVLVDVLSRAPQTIKSTSHTDILENAFSTNNTSVEVVEMTPSQGLTDSYQNDQMFGKLVAALDGILPEELVQ